VLAHIRQYVSALIQGIASQRSVVRNDGVEKVKITLAIK